MPTEHILTLLITERDKLTRAIEALQGGTKPLGRELKNQVPAIESNTAKPKKRHVSAAARRRMAAAQKKRWAAVKAAKTATNKPKTTRKSAQG
jgi:hypothetical protein